MAGEIAGETAGNDLETEPSWDNDIFQIFEIYCNTCHANPPTGGAPFPLKTYQDALPYLERFQERVIERKDMPPGGIPDQIALEKVEQWIAGGGLQ